jgi:hypothetical protein
MVDLRDAAVGAWQHEIVQHVFAACRQGAPYPVLAETRNEVMCELGRRLAKDERQEESATDREHEHRGAHARYPACNGRLRRNRGQRNQRQAGQQRSEDSEHASRIGPIHREVNVMGHVFDE